MVTFGNHAVLGIEPELPTHKAFAQLVKLSL